MSGNPRKTPLSHIHEALGAKMVDFHGWLMPIQYTSIIEEHKVVREKVGIFDICHMGEIEVKGEGAMELLSRLTPNDLTQLQEGDVQYSAFLNENAGIIDDLLIYFIGKDRYFLCVNASNATTDFNWINKHLRDFPKVTVTNLSYDYGMLSIQGPNSEPLMKQFTNMPLAGLGYYKFASGMMGEHNVILSRTGYTGEDGFEIFCQWRDTTAIWEKLMTKSKQFGLKPIGLGARDTLRMEMRYALHGNDINTDTTPLEAGLGWIVKLDKEGGFIGQDILLRQKEKGVGRKLVGIELVARGIPRQGMTLLKDGKKVGEMTSGTMSPTLGKSIGLGYVRADLAIVGTPLMVDIRGKEVEAVVAKTPFVRSRVKKEKPAAPQ